jgi:hypothetical protein
LPLAAIGVQQFLDQATHEAEDADIVPGEQKPHGVFVLRGDQGEQRTV